MPLGREEGLIVLDGDPAPLPQRGTALPNFEPCSLWPNGWIDQDAAWYGGKPRPRSHCVRWGRSSPPPKGHRPPIIGPCLLWPNGWMDQDVTWQECRPRPRPHYVKWRPSFPSPKGAHLPRIFGPCVLWPNGRPSQNGGRLPSCIYYVHVWTTYEEYLVVFITVQKLVGIRALVSIICPF